MAEPLLEKVELTWFARDPDGIGSSPARAVYDLVYNTHTSDQSGNFFSGTNWSIAKPCGGAADDAKTASVGLLTRLVLPSGERYDFTYDATHYSTPSTASCSDLSGTLLAADLPTRGRTEWDYQIYATDMPDPNSRAIGVKERRALTATRQLEQKTTYTPYTSGKRVIETYAPGTTSWTVDSKTEAYFGWNLNAEYFGLPITTDAALKDGTRFLSTRTYDCSAGNCDSLPMKASYLRYEGSYTACISPDSSCTRDRN